MSKLLLDTLTFPDALKDLSYNELLTLSDEIRHRLIDITNTVGGHLASNLGVVELTLALHTLFNSPKDKFLWDTSHQTYVHKMLTGRLNQMYTIKQYKGLSGFAKISESEHDTFGAGHASTSLSAAIGLAQARNARNEDHSVVCVLGDGGLSGGMAYEALNNIKELKGNFICILNDNDMSISPPVGAMANYMTTIRTTKVYDEMKDKFQRVFDRIPKIGTPLKRRIEKTVKRFRSSLIDIPSGVLFEEFGFKYLGPIDGHNLTAVMAALKYAKDYDGPVMLHIMTTKGKGMDVAEKNPVKYHGVSAQKTKTTEIKEKRPTYTQCFGSEIIDIAEKNPNVHVITPAMREGSGLVEYEKKFPDRYYDVGIAEEHAVTFAAGLAKGGVTPVLAIYSTFLQRGFDQVIHDVCLQKLPMVFAIDRAGLVGADGPTHHGVFDYSYLLLIPNMVICAPKDGTELKQMLAWATNEHKIVSIRYPRGEVPIEDGEAIQPIEYSKCQIMIPPPSKSLDILIIATGNFVWPAVSIANELKSECNASISVINLRFIKPLDKDTLEPLIKSAKCVAIIEDGSKIGGVFNYILSEFGHLDKPLSEWTSFSIPDRFIDHGPVNDLFKEISLHPEQIKTILKEKVKHKLLSSQT
ncbi:1-deoxy-D-xylulose-5-phosphate synthase [Candidatus Marinamargulisbacteria bacterium SCGC AG-343-K17]|nr:1-deoxy-D-xylulose-5-phosphate synthase [Candidatus Marinamargulisbacteria bacterium SCGC AG-343-K17]